MTLFVELLAVAVLILLNAFFVAAEYGLVTARRTRIRELEEQGNRRARSVLQIVSNPPRFIAAMQLGVTATSLAIGAVGEQALAKVFDPILASVIAIALAFLIITFLHVVIGELVPKGVALRHSETTALAVSAPVRGFFVVMRPLIWVLQQSSEVVLRALGIEPLHKAERRTLTPKAVRETEAEAVAFVVCHALGLETGTGSSDYIQLYHGDANLLKESLEVVQRTANVILGAISPEDAQTGKAVQ